MKYTYTKIAILIILAMILICGCDIMKSTRPDVDLKQGYYGIKCGGKF
jgi:hypothetical protein